jgi:cell division protein FtsW
VDRTILAVVLLLVGVGTVMVFSASSSVATARYGDNAYYLKRHLLRVAMGLTLMFILARARYVRVARLWRPLMGISLAALVLVLLPGLGAVAAKGAQRWLSIGPFAFQPSDMARFALLLWLADTLAARREILGRFTDGLVPVLVPVGAAVGLIFLEPDYSTALVLAAVCFGLIYMSGARVMHLGSLLLSAVPVAYAALMSSAYRRNRILAFLESGTDLQGTNYQVWQSLIGLGSGGILGQGLGESAQKQRFLPEPYNDFIFSVIGEELGFVGAITILVLFLVLVMRGFKVARAATDPVGSLLAAGVSLTIGLYALVNVGVVTSALPATGLVLPFISYGGSSLLFTLAGVGLLLSVSRDVNLEPADAGGGPS